MSKLKGSHYKNVSMDPLRSVEHALETAGVLAVLKDLDQLYQLKKCYGDVK
jgi:hypothetical protein